MFSIAIAAALLAPSNPVADAWAKCLTDQVERLSTGSGTADQVAGAAIRNCASHEIAVRRWVERNAGDASAREVGAEFDKLGREARAEMRKLTIQVRALRAAGGAGTVPGANDRAAARQRAATADRRQTAREAALKQDLKFRLFNASSGTITGFAMLKGGNSSSNWLKGKSVAAGQFRPLTFFSGTSCSHNTRVTFASGRTATQMINYCGKDVLYVSDNEIWAE